MDARDAVNELYVHAADMVQATESLRRSAGRPGALPAAPSALACIDAAARNLTAAIAEIAASLERASGPATRDPGPQRARHRARCGLANLEVALVDAADAADAARGLTSRALGEGRPALAAAAPDDG